MLFVAGSIGGALVDQIHVRSGVLSYPKPSVAGQPWWVAPQFGVGALLVQASAERVAPRVEPRAIPADAVWFFGAYAASGLLSRRPRALTAVFIVTWLARVRREPALALYSVALAAAGTAYEAWWSSTGAFSYSQPDVAGVPMWLPGLYLNGAPLAIEVARSGGRI